MRFFQKNFITSFFQKFVQNYFFYKLLLKLLQIIRISNKGSFKKPFFNVFKNFWNVFED